MGLYKRKDVWWMSFTYRGRQVRQSTDVSSKGLAEKIYCKVISQIAEGKWFEKGEGEDKTITDLLDKYHTEHIIPNKSQKNISSDLSAIREMKTFFGMRPLKEISPKLISEYKMFCREKKFAPATINARRVLLNHAFKLAIREWEWLKENPVERVAPEKVRNARDRWLTFEEERNLLKACVLHPTVKENKTEPRYWLQEVVFFAMNTGMRQDEILSLEWANVDLFRRTATVVKSKNGEKRTIPLNLHIMDLLNSKTKVRSIKANFVFFNEAGNKIDAANLLRGFRKVLKRTEIKDFRFHDLRHTFATRLAQAGVDFYKISKLMGHKDIRMTQRYSHHYPESLRDGVEVLDKIITNLSQIREEELSVSS